jgi:hypothetical protein
MQLERFLADWLHVNPIPIGRFFVWTRLIQMATEPDFAEKRFDFASVRPEVPTSSTAQSRFDSAASATQPVGDRAWIMFPDYF